MRIPRIYTEQALEAGGNLILEPEASRHLSQVLRLKSGDPVILFDGGGSEFSATIEQSGKLNTQVRLGELIGNEPEAPLAIELLLGISRGERMDYALQKAVELGVSRVQPLYTKRVMVKLDPKRLPRRMQHWRRIIIGACEQSGSCRIPDLAEPCTLTDAAGKLSGSTALLLDHRSELALPTLSRPEGTITLLIGPEGGLSAEERDQALARGFTGVRLGPRILRSETAPLAAIAVIQALWGDFR
jgi:16S rRNA (uracil1498-N3)-methyltransferase